jgi:hypothetical protein
MDVVSYMKAKQVDDRLTQAIQAGNNPSGWMAERDAINAKLTDAGKQSQTLQNGVNVVNATVDAPADIEIQGRTLTSLGQSNLYDQKYYVLTNKKTKVRVNGTKGTQYTGVTKFQHSQPTSRTANFNGKVAGSTAENPNSFKYFTTSNAQSTLTPPTDVKWTDVAAVSNIYTLNNTVASSAYYASGAIAQQLFSFDIIQEVERNLGRIPKLTVADKVQWLKDNIASLQCNWYGYGSGPNGNKASLAYYSNTWVTGSASHTSGTVTKITRNISLAADLVNLIDSNGFINFLAYADPSDGVTASTINTDYVELVITLNASAQLDTRPILSRVANFENKVSGSTVENPHVTREATSSALTTPGAGAELIQNDYNKANTLDSLNSVTSTNSSGKMAERVFSFDIVQEVERHLGRIPKATLADKVQWCKDNLKTLITNWYGYGSSVGGNKATLGVWVNNSWVTSKTSTSSSVANLVDTSNTIIPNMIDSNGFAHFLAYADPAGNVADPTVAPTLSASGSGSSLAAGTYYVQYTWVTANGETMTSPEGNITITSGQDIVVTIPSLPFGATQANVYIGTTSGGEYRQSNTTVTTYTQHTSLLTNTATSASRTTNTAVVASTINTDYVELQIDLKPEAVLHDPLVQLYEVDSTEYSNILVTWDETSVLNRYPKVQGVQHLQNPYVLAEGENLIPPFSDPAWALHANTQVTAPYELTLNATANYQNSELVLKVVKNNLYFLSFNTSDAAVEIAVYDDDNKAYIRSYNSALSFTFNSGNTNTIRLQIRNGTKIGTFVFSNPILTLGSTAKPFTPRNPSYLFTTAKLGQIGTVKDVLYKNDGQWYVRKAVEKDFIIKRSNVPDANIIGITYGTTSTRFAILTGYAVPSGAWNLQDNQAPFYDSRLISTFNGRRVMLAGYNLYLTSDIVLCGFEESSVIYVGIPHAISGWASAPTAAQVLDFLETNELKMSYQLATPVVQTAQVEGDIALNGPTQVQVGSGVIVREKVVPRADSYNYYINDGSTGWESQRLKSKNEKIISIYKNGNKDSLWSLVAQNYNNYGKQKALIPLASYDSTAEYTVTYLLYTLDNTVPAFANNGLEFKVTYDTSLKSVLDSLVERQSDLGTISSVNVQAIAELYKRVRSLGG